MIFSRLLKTGTFRLSQNYMVKLQVTNYERYILFHQKNYYLWLPATINILFEGSWYMQSMT